MNIHLLTPFFLLVSLACAAPLTPESASRFALDNNPRLAAARAVLAEAEARASGLGRLPPPELETEFAAGSGERARLQLGLTQTFPRTARLRLERHLAAESLAVARHEIAVAETVTLARVRTAFVDLAAAEAALTLAQQQADLAREQADTWQAQAAAGQRSGLDATHAELLARERTFALAEPLAARRTAASRLATELGLAPDTIPAITFDLSVPPTPPPSPAPGPRPDLALAEASLSAGHADLALARSVGREAWRLGLFVEGEQDRNAFGRREQDAKLGFRFSIPLPTRHTASPALAEKQATCQRLILERDALLALAHHELVLATAELTAHHHTALALGQDLLPALRTHLAAVESAQSRGEADLAQVYLARERLAQIERAELAARLAYHLAHVRLLNASGQLLP